MDDFCTKKGIKREFSNARTPQQNGLAERRNKTLIKAARTMLADAKLPVTFWAEACLHGVMFKLGFRLTRTSSTNISGTKEDANQAVKDNVSSLRFIALPNWFHDAHMETSNDSVRNSEANDYPQKEQDGTADVSESSGNTNPTASSKDSLADQVEPVLSPTVESDVPNVSSPVSTVSTNVLDSDKSIPPITLSLPKIISRGGSSYSEPLSLGNVMGDFFGDTTNSTSLTKVEADISNMETDIQVSPTPTLRINKDHLKIQVIGPIDPPVQTRHKAKNVEEQSFIATIHQKTNLDLLQYCLFSCILSQEEPKKIVDALKDESWVEAMQEELLQFQIQNVWVLVDCPKGVRPIGTKWALKNKKDKRGIVIQNKARLVVQGHT
ncbi:putative ribonuclease H-like domain-containing protein [Tanacetum coccineum]